MSKNNNSNKVIIKREGIRCFRCGYEWIPKSPNKRPRVCPKCVSPWYDVPRKNKKRNKVKTA